MNTASSSVKSITKYPGYGFYPSDEMLIGFYLARKNCGKAKEEWPISEVNLCELEPWDLPGSSKRKSDKILFFFHPRQFMDEKAQRCKRKTKAGYWKPTGRSREIKGNGKKKTLVFYKNGPKGSKSVRTEWVIQEYYANSGGEFVLIKLKNKVDEKIKKSKLIDSSSSDYVNDNQEEEIMANSANSTEVSAMSTNDHGEPSFQSTTEFEEGDQLSPSATSTSNEEQLIDGLCPLYSPSYTTEFSLENDTFIMENDKPFFEEGPWWNNNGIFA